MKNFIIAIIIVFCFASVQAQHKELPKSGLIKELVKSDSIYLMLNNYLIENNFIEPENNEIYLFNLLSWKEFDLTDSCGMYVFGIKFTDPTLFLLFRNKDKSYSIVKNKSLPLILNKAMMFFDKNDINNKEQQLFFTLSLLKFFNSDNDYLIDEKYLPREWNK